MPFFEFKSPPLQGPSLPPQPRPPANRTPATPRCTSIRALGQSFRGAVQQFDRVRFLQSCARGVVSFVGTGTVVPAFLAIGIKQCIEIQLERNSGGFFGQTVFLSESVGKAVTSTAAAAMVAVAATDALFHEVFAEEKGKETWSGTAKRNAPGLVVALGATAMVGTAVPVLYGLSKGMHKVTLFCEAYGKDANAQFFNYQGAVIKAKEVIGILRGTHTAKKA